ncbi:DUF6161 domain-containing protein [Sphingomonas sp.]|uniref:DUF6161 domain-containing protein n=1 Tax=Sphingomonas sp. TaxID=28214 RepID=UPI003BABD6F8
MLNIELGPFAGGLRAFSEREQISSFIDEQRGLWRNEDESFYQAASNQNSPPSAQLNYVISKWNEMRQHFQNLNQQFLDNDENFSSNISRLFKSTKPINLHYPQAVLVRKLFHERGIHVAAGALRYLVASPGESLADVGTRGGLEGVFLAWADGEALGSEAVRRSRDSIRLAVRRIEEDYAEHHAKLEENLEETRREIDQFAATSARLAEEFANNEERREGGYQSAENDRAARWKESYDLYVSQLKIRAAVKQWGDRAEGHENTYLERKRWALGTGVVGTSLAVAVSWGALSLAKWLFSDALVEGTAIVQAGTLRPTWVHELIFAGSVSLLYLTLFLWLLRVLVRMLMAEQHLAVDARSRESMAHTYLALLEQQAVSEDADRAIILAALFRPVTDGLVKDDALPLISPATILSGQLAGKP